METQKNSNTTLILIQYILYSYYKFLYINNFISPSIIKILTSVIKIKTFNAYAVKINENKHMRIHSFYIRSLKIFFSNLFNIHHYQLLILKKMYAHSESQVNLSPRLKKFSLIAITVMADEYDRLNITISRFLARRITNRGKSSYSSRFLMVLWNSCCA